MVGMIGWMMLPTLNSHGLIPQIYEYVTLHTKRNFEALIKLRFLKCKITWIILVDQNVIIRSLGEVGGSG